MWHKIKKVFSYKYITSDELAKETDLQKPECRYMLDELTDDGLLIEVKPETYIISKDTEVQEVINSLQSDYNIDNIDISQYLS